MASLDASRALLFDVFGTCVDWRGTVTDALYARAHVALNSATASLATSVRMQASDMTLADWGTFAQQWRDSYKHFTRSLAADPAIPWRTVDEHHLDSLQRLITEWKIDGLWADEEVQALSLIWHQLDPWPDSAAGIRLFNRKFSTATLSNGNISLLEDLKKHGNMEFTYIYSAEMFGSYKPSRNVYLGAVERLGLKPNECVMVAAHLNDLQAAKSHGLRVIYVERALEEEWNSEDVEKAKRDGWVDIWISLDEGGFVAVAEKLGITEPPNS